MELLRAQTEAGYGLHLFDPKAFDPDAEPLPDIPSPTVVPTPAGSSLIHGLEDTSSDSHLWLVPSVVEYVKETGDLAFLDLEVPVRRGHAQQRCTTTSRRRWTSLPPRSAPTAWPWACARTGTTA